MSPSSSVDGILREAADGRPISKAEAEFLLSLPENSTEAALLRSVANRMSRKRFSNSAVLLGQIGVDMAPCDGGCAFCAFAKPHTTVKPSLLPTDEVIARCEMFARGGAQGVFLMTMHRFGFDWFLDLCSTLRKSIPASLEILANVGDLALDQMVALRGAGVSGAYHVCRLREGVDTHMSPKHAHRRRLSVSLKPASPGTTRASRSAPNTHRASWQSRFGWGLICPVVSTPPCAGSLSPDRRCMRTDKSRWHDWHRLSPSLHSPLCSRST